MRTVRNIVVLSLMALLMSECAFSHRTSDAVLPLSEADAAPIVVPFRLLSNHMIAVEAQLDSIKGYFIFDSGSPVTMVNSRYFPPLRKRQEGSSRIVDVSGGTLAGRATYPSHELDFQGIKVSGKEYLSIQMSQMAEEDGMEPLGMLGTETVEGYDILFDYQDSTLTLIPPADTDAYIGSRYPGSRKTEIAAEVVEHVICVPVQIGEDVYQLALDSGAGGNIFSNLYRRQLAPHSRPVGAMELMGVSRIPVRATEIQVHRMDIGGRSFENTRFLLHDLRAMGVSTDDGIDGLAGYDILSQQKTLVSLTSRRVIFID